MNELMMPFDFHGHCVRTVPMLNNKPYFVGRDVAKVLGYERPDEAVNTHCVNKVRISFLDLAKTAGASSYEALRESGYSHNDLVRKQGLIPEADVYRLVMRSRLPGATAFQDWVCEDVLPAIRMTGSYICGKPSQETTVSKPEALKVAQEFYGLVTSVMPNLGEVSRQTLMVTLARDVAGIDCLPLPKVEERFWTASELAAEFLVTPQKLGRVANVDGLKTPEYGEYRLSKSRHSNKQVEQFFYNARARKRLAALLNCTLDDCA